MVFRRNRNELRPVAGERDEYDAAVRICRPGAAQDSANSVVFRVSRMWPFTEAGEARRACKTHAERIINGEIPGQSTEGL